MSATANVSMVMTRSKGAAKAAPAAAQASSSVANAIAIATGVVGVYSSYLTQGVLQERLATTTYAGRRFDGLDALHGAQAAACAAFALLLLAAVPALRPSKEGDVRRSKKESPSSSSSVAPPVAYWRAGLSNSVGPTLGYLALKNISYPAQVRGKREGGLIGFFVPFSIEHSFFFFERQRR